MNPAAVNFLKSRWEIALLALLWLGMLTLGGSLLLPAPEYTLVLERTALSQVLPVTSAENLDAAPLARIEQAPAPRRRAKKEKAPPPVVNVNTATADQLDLLPGIGPKFAERIVAYRAAHGPFTSPEQLIEVKGIGPKTLEKMRAFVRL